MCHPQLHLGAMPALTAGVLALEQLAMPRTGAGADLPAAAGSSAR